VSQATLTGPAWLFQLMQLVLSALEQVWTLEMDLRTVLRGAGEPSERTARAHALLQSSLNDVGPVLKGAQKEFLSRRDELALEQSETLGRLLALAQLVLSNRVIATFYAQQLTAEQPEYMLEAAQRYLTLVPVEVAISDLGTLAYDPRRQQLSDA
jgi:hypothetical protein